MLYKFREHEFSVTITFSDSVKIGESTFKDSKTTKLLHLNVPVNIEYDNEERSATDNFNYILDQVFEHILDAEKKRPKTVSLYLKSWSSSGPKPTTVYGNWVVTSFRRKGKDLPTKK